MEANDSSRLEAFSDGVLAIAITLLILDLKVPPRDELDGHSLAWALSKEWPGYAAYLVSFLIIGIIWVNHHAMFRLIARVDRPLLFANLALLLLASAIPFPTRLLAEYLTAGQDAHTAAAVYSGTMFATAVAFTVLWLVATRDAGLLHEELDPAMARRSLIRFGAGVVVYAGTIALAFVSATLTLATHFVIAAYYCADQLAGARAPDPRP